MDMEQATGTTGVLGRLAEDLSVADLVGVPSGGMENVAYRWLATLMPDGGNAFTHVIGIFTSALLLLGSAVLVWHVIAGMVASAHEGTVLGQRWHQIWAPVRVVIGVGLLAPIPAGNGLSSIHYLIQSGALVSIGLADEVWSGFVGAISTDGRTIVPVSSGGRDLVMQFAESEACRLAVNARNRAAGDAPDRDIPLPPPDGEWKKPDVVSWDYGQPCGAILLEMPQGQGTDFAGARREVAETVLQDIREAAFLDPYITRLTGGDGSSITDQYVVDLEAAKALPLGVAQYVRELGDWYDGRVREAAGAEAYARDEMGRGKLVDYAAKKGWISAGLYWRNLSQTSQLTADLARVTPQRVDPDPSEWGASREQIDTVLSVLRAQATGQVNPVEIDANDLAAAGDSQAGWVRRQLAPLARVSRSATEWAGSRSVSDDPVGDMISFGHNVLAVSETIVVAAGAAAVTAATAGSSLPGKLIGADGGVNTAIMWALPWVGMAVLAALTVGLLHAYIIPAVPFFYVMCLALAWVVSILEAAIAGPLFALALIRMDGQDFIADAQRPGVMAIFAIVLKPVLGILAFCGSYAVVVMALSTFNELWGLAFAGQQGGHTVDPLGILAAWGIGAFLAWQLTLRSFALTVELPDRVGRWFGLNATSYGEEREGTTIVAGTVALSQQGVQQGAGALAKVTPKSKPTPKEKDSGVSRRHSTNAE